MFKKIKQYLILGFAATAYFSLAGCAGNQEKTQNPSDLEMACVGKAWFNNSTKEAAKRNEAGFLLKQKDCYDPNMPIEYNIKKLDEGSFVMQAYQ